MRMLVPKQSKLKIDEKRYFLTKLYQVDYTNLLIYLPFFLRLLFIYLFIFCRGEKTWRICLNKRKKEKQKKKQWC